MRVMMTYELFNMWQNLGEVYFIFHIFFKWTLIIFSLQLLWTHMWVTSVFHNFFTTVALDRINCSLIEDNFKICVDFRREQDPFHSWDDRTVPRSDAGPSGGGEEHHDPDLSRHDGLGAAQKWKLQTGTLIHVHDPMIISEKQHRSALT